MSMHYYNRRHTEVIEGGNVKVTTLDDVTPIADKVEPKVEETKKVEPVKKSVKRKGL